MKKLVQSTMVIVGLLGACHNVPPNQHAIDLATPAIEKMNKGEDHQQAGENDRKYVMNQISDPQVASFDPNGPSAAASYFGLALPLLTDAETALQSALAVPDLADLQRQYYQLLVDKCEADKQFIQEAQKEVAILDAFVKKELGGRNQADVDQVNTDITSSENSLKELQSKITEAANKIYKIIKDHPEAFKTSES